MINFGKMTNKFSGKSDLAFFLEAVIRLIIVIILFLADRTATQYDRLLASSCRPSVRPSVYL